MAAKGYCTTIDIGDFLAVDLTTAQTSQAEALIEQAESVIDRETGRAWLTGAQTDEEHYYPKNYIHLKYAPITTVTSVTGRSGIGENEETLTVNDDYEIRDTDTGLLYLVYPSSYDRIRVDYTPVATVPAAIKMACVEIVANWLQPHLQPGTFGLDSYSLPDLTVKFSRSHVQNPLPPNAQRILEMYRYRTHG